MKTIGFGLAPGRMRGTIALAAALMTFGSQLCGQEFPGASKPQVMMPLRWYAAPAVAPIRIANSSRLYSLIRAGNLYLTAHDAIALAIENNLGLEIDRYGPLLAQEALDRSHGGGPLRGVPSGSSQISSVNNGVGVNGSVAAAGLQNGNGGGGGGGSGNTVVQQVGQVTPNLDPVLQSAVNFSHLTQPQANTVVSGTPSLIQSVRAYNTTLQEGLLTGGTVAYQDYEQHLFENAPSDILNPVSAPRMALTYKQPLLQGFGWSLNNRFIRIADLNVTASRDSFRAQMLDLVTSVLNLYWDYVNANDELRLRQHALELADKFRQDTRYEISIGALAGVEMPRAEAEFARNRQDVAIAEATLRERAIALKDAISHTEDPALEQAQIVPLDRIEVADAEDLLPLRQMVAQAMAKRPDVAVSRIQDQTQAMGLAGTTNPLLPTLTMTLQTYNRGVAGAPQASGGAADPYFVGGLGNGLQQVLRRDFPNNVATLLFSAPLHNRQAQGDYGIDQLQYRQSQVRGRHDENQIVVDISSQTSALRQARARWEIARNTRVLQEQLLAAERNRSYGPQTFQYIMADQRALTAAQLTELSAAAAWMRARVALDQVMGNSLERNHITLEEGLSGRVAQ
ncbi:MAG TPA: TolC family protein [Bryobacteraceae bacterium]|nr:TolC family protein [Bryobacteraceae bacterium]